MSGTHEFVLDFILGRIEYGFAILVEEGSQISTNQRRESTVFCL